MLIDSANDRFFTWGWPDDKPLLSLVIELAWFLNWALYLFSLGGYSLRLSKYRGSGSLFLMLPKLFF